MAKHSTPDRKSLFRAALALNGLTAEEWGFKHGVTGGAVSLCVNGLRPQSDLNAKIDAFIEKHMSKQQTALAS